MAVNDSIFGGPSNIRLPPDSAGKRTQTFRHVHLEYNNGVVAINLGDTVVGATSGAHGEVVAKAESNTTSNGTLSVVPLISAEDAQFIVGEDLQVNLIKVAEAVDLHDVHSSAVNLCGANNPHNAQFVDSKGSAYIRFDDGPQQLDAFGLSRMTTPWMVGFYDFHYDTLPNEFWDDISGTGTITHLPDEASIALDVGTAAGDRVTRTSHKYHLYQPGYSQLIEMTAVAGDSGKANVRRRSGYFDDENGVFFEMDGTDIYVVLRSKVTGSVVDTRIAQTNWNGDKLDGTGGLGNLSGMQLHPDKLQVLWMDMQWLGGGRVRFGVLAPDGSRVTCHTIENANANTGAYMTTATLPLRVEIENTGTSGSPSRIKMVCAAVKTEGQLLPDRKKRTEKFGVAGAKHDVTTATDTPMLAMRPALTVNSVTNRKIMIPERWSLIVEGDPIVLKFWRRTAGTTGGSYAQVPNSAMELNSGVTSFTPASSHLMLVDYYTAGSYSIQAPENFGYLGQHGRLNADGTTQEVWLVTAALATASGTDADVTMGFSWIELE